MRILKWLLVKNYYYPSNFFKGSYFNFMNYFKDIWQNKKIIRNKPIDLDECFYKQKFPTCILILIHQILVIGMMIHILMYIFFIPNE